MTAGPRLGGPFWRLWVSSTCSNLADGIGAAAVPLLAATLTRDPVQVSAMTSLAFLPWLLFAVPGGTVVDRMDRRTAMAAANVARAALLAVLATLVLTRAAAIWQLYLVAFALGTAEVIYDSAARAVLPQVVPPDRLDRGNSALTAGETVAQTFLGAPLGALLFATAAAVPFFANAAGFTMAAALALTMRGNFTARSARRASFRADLREGIRWLARHRFLRTLTLTSALSATCNAMVSGIIVLYALQVWGLSESAFGIALTAIGATGLLAAVATGRLVGRLGRVGALAAAALVQPVALALTGGLGLIRPGWFGLGLALFAVNAGAITMWNIVSMSVRQAMIPEELFGRVLGVYRMGIWGGIPAGALLGGVLAGLWSLPAVLIVAGAGQLLVAWWTVRLLRRHRAQIDAAFVSAGQPA